MDALPPQTPSTPSTVSASGQSNQGHFRYFDGSHELVFHVQGQVDVQGETELHFSAGSHVRVELTSPDAKRTVHWDAKACYITGAGAGSCIEADRRSVVNALKQRPKTPTPPQR